MKKALKEMREDARSIFYAALKAVDPAQAVKRWLHLEENILKIGRLTFPLSKIRKIYVVGAGKAGAPMANALEEIIGDRIEEGLINVKYGHSQKLAKIEINEAGHPLPDKAGRRGAQRIFHLLEKAGENDLVFCLISGGGSALLPLPVKGISLEEKQEVTETLLRCGARIEEINAIRKHLSRIKGGQIARWAYPARLIVLILSDVIGDRLDTIASGPTVPDETTFVDCLKIVNKYGISSSLPVSAINHLGKGAAGEIKETPQKGDPIFVRVHNFIVGSNIMAIKAAQREAEKLKYHSLVLSSFLQGESREIARIYAAMAREIRTSRNPLSPPACIICGGETTVTLRGQGLGGRSQEFVLSAAIEVEGMKRVTILAAGTDGTDGPTDAAGALVDGETLMRARELGMDALTYLDNNDSYHFFEKLGDLLITGPTRTNVMDLYLLLVS